jgi:hypothetical protein
VLEKVPRGGGEEVHYGLGLERWRIRDVDDDRGALKGLLQARAGETVDAGRPTACIATARADITRPH